MTKLLSFRSLVCRTHTLSKLHSLTTAQPQNKIFKSICRNNNGVNSRTICTTNGCMKDNKDEDDYKEYPRITKPEDDPIGRTLRILKHDLTSIVDKNQKPLQEFSSHVDVLIIGGGIMGSCIAHTILDRIPSKTLAFMVVEKDPSYRQSATAMSIGGLRQQFSLRENVEMAQYGREYFRTIRKRLDIDGDPAPDIQFHPYGYLQLANEQQAQTMQESWLLQKELGCHVELLTQEKLKNRFPWINTNGVELALYGMEGEGWFDAWALHFGLKKKAWYLGAEYVQAEVVGFEFEDSKMQVSGQDHGEKHETVKRATLRTPSGELKTVFFSQCIIAAGHESGRIAEMARIGRRPGLLSVPLPVEPRKRYVYCIHAPEGPGIDCPLVVNTDGTYFRREGYAGHFVAGKSPALGEEPEIGNLDVDYDYFEHTVWPSIAYRVPGFRNIKLNSAWAGYYDYNTFDQSCVVGPHPYYFNLWFACGLSGHGIQQAPAIAQAFNEMIIDGEFRTLDMTKFHFERFYIGKQIKEELII